MPPNMRPLFAQLHRNSRSIGYGQQTRNFASSHPGTSSESTVPWWYITRPWWYITRALAVAVGYGVLGPRLFSLNLAEHEKRLKEHDEFLDLMERTSSVRES